MYFYVVVLGFLDKWAGFVIMLQINSRICQSISKLLTLHKIVKSNNMNIKDRKPIIEVTIIMNILSEWKS